MIRIGILTVSDMGAQGRREDSSGDAILDWAAAQGYEVVVRSIVPDETTLIAGKLARWAALREGVCAPLDPVRALAPREP